jgi:serine O-acetyltransferase
MQSSNWVGRIIGEIVYRGLYPVVELWTGVSLPREVEVGRNLQIHHRGKIVVHPNVTIGQNCAIVHGVTIGNRYPGGDVPRIGNNVQVGAYAQILGGVEVGDGSKIGSLAIVLDDVPAGATVVPAKSRVILQWREP